MKQLRQSEGNLKIKTWRIMFVSSKHKRYVLASSVFAYKVKVQCQMYLINYRVHHLHTFLPHYVILWSVAIQNVTRISKLIVYDRYEAVCLSKNHGCKIIATIRRDCNRACAGELGHCRLVYLVYVICLYSCPVSCASLPEGFLFSARTDVHRHTNRCSHRITFIYTLQQNVISRKILESIIILLG